MSSVSLSKLLYQTIRAEFGLKSQLTQSAIRTVTARYESVITQMKQQPYKFKDKYTNKWYKVYRDLTWLQRPVFLYAGVITALSKAKKQEKHFYR